MKTIDTQALTIPCPACFAAAGEPCTAPTDTGRRVVAWVHMSREDGIRILHFGPEKFTPDGRSQIRAACGVRYFDPRDTFTEDPLKVTCLRCRATRRYATEELVAQLPVKDFFLTFGVQFHTEPHPTWPECNPSGYVRITARTYEQARDIAVARFGQAWSMLTPSANFTPDRFFPAGELMVLP